MAPRLLLLILAVAAVSGSIGPSARIEAFALDPGDAEAGVPLRFRANVTDISGQGLEDAFLLFGLDPAFRFSYDAAVIAHAPVTLAPGQTQTFVGTETRWFGPDGEVPWNATLGGHAMNVEVRRYGSPSATLNVSFDVGPRTRGPPDGRPLADLVIQSLVLDRSGLGRDPKLHVRVENRGHADAGNVTLRIEPPEFLPTRVQPFPAVPAGATVEATYYGGEYELRGGASRPVHAWIDAYDDTWENDETNNEWSGVPAKGRAPGLSAWQVLVLAWVVAGFVARRRPAS